MSASALTSMARTTCPKARRMFRCFRTSLTNCSNAGTVKETSARYLVKICCVCLRKRNASRAVRSAAKVALAGSRTEYRFNRTYIKKRARARTSVLKAEKKRVNLTSDSGRHDSEFRLFRRRNLPRRLPCFAFLFGHRTDHHFADHHHVVRLADPVDLAGPAGRLCRVTAGRYSCPSRQHPCFSGGRRSSFCHLPCLYSSHLLDDS